MKIVICTHKTWNVENARRFQEENKKIHQVKIIEKKEDLQISDLEEFTPDFIFFPHWSYIIPQDIYENYLCIVFHMTDLPFGRGGSPLQNLIARGYEKTKISAIHVNAGLDTGDIYCKEELGLTGTADEIFKRASAIIFTTMIPEILKGSLKPQKQRGEAVTFRRRKPEQSKLDAEMDIKQLYDQIRMLDGEGYPKAYMELGEYQLQFSQACLQEGKLTAKVTFVLKEDK